MSVRFHKHFHFVFIFFLLSPLFSKTTLNSPRLLDLNLGVGTSVPSSGTLARETQGQFINRVGFTYQWNNLLENKPLILRTGILLSRKGLRVGISFQERWIFSMLETQWSATWWSWEKNGIYFTPGLSLVPSYNLSFHIKGAGIISAPQYLNKFQFDTGVFGILEYKSVGTRIYYHHSLTNPVTLHKFKVNHIGIEILIPLARQNVMEGSDD